MPEHVNALPARDGYRLWASQYNTETAISRLEDLTVRSMTIPTAGRKLLDVGCGTGRRLRDSNASLAVGVDITFEMLASSAESLPLAASDILALPVVSNAFDIVWCRLMMGHVRDIRGAYLELARVARPGGAIVVTDLTTEAVDAGHRRTFSGEDGTTHELEHFAHGLGDHLLAASFAGLELDDVRDGCVGPAIKEFYEAAGRVAAYESQAGFPLIRVLKFRKLGTDQQWRLR